MRSDIKNVQYKQNVPKIFGTFFLTLKVEIFYKMFIIKV